MSDEMKAEPAKPTGIILNWNVMNNIYVTVQVVNSARCQELRKLW